MADQTILEFEYLSAEKKFLLINKKSWRYPRRCFGLRRNKKFLCQRSSKSFRITQYLSQVMFFNKEESHSYTQRGSINPSNDKPVHVDFMRVSSKTKITMQVPTKFISEDICLCSE